MGGPARRALTLSTNGLRTLASLGFGLAIGCPTASPTADAPTPERSDPVTAPTPPDRPAPPTLKMTKPHAGRHLDPDDLETRVGVLTGFDGVPDERTMNIVYDNRERVRLRRETPDEPVVTPETPLGSPSALSPT